MKVKVKQLKPFVENPVYNLLRNRGLTDAQIPLFLNPNESLLTEPDKLDNIDKGAKLLYNTLMVRGRILIVVDCDCDGFTSSAIIYQYIKKIQPEAIIDYVIHEHKQHGLEDHIEKIIKSETHYELIIEPDAGTNDFPYHKQLKELGTKILVIDHHELDSESTFEDNAIIINNQLSKNYLNKELTGAGVTWQFCRYFDKKYKYRFADDFIDLAALGVIGDMGSVLELENRYIIKKGVHFPSENIFFNELLKKQKFSITGDSMADDRKMNECLTPTAIAFYIVPYINAMVRSGTLEEKKRMFEAFIHGDRKVPSKKRGAKGELVPIAVESVRECTNAKSHQDKLKQKMAEKMEIKIHKYGLLENKVLFVRLDEDDDEFPSELNGLLAMQLAAKFKRPTIVARLNDEGYVRGSARGLNDSELESFKDLLLDSHMFEYAQGHPNAFGCSIPNANLSAFHSYANEQLSYINFNENVYEVDFVRSKDAADLEDLVLTIGSYPDLWGQQNKQPLICIEDFKISSSSYSVIGSKKDTLRFESNGITYIKFRAKDEIEELSQYNGLINVTIVGKMAINEWMGNKKPQIMIENMEIKDDRFSF